MPPQQSKISGKHVFLYLPSLKEHIPVFIIFFRPKLQELRGVEVAPPLSTGAKTYQLYHRRGLRLFARNVGVREVAEEERGRGLALASLIETLFRNTIGMLSWCFATFSGNQTFVSYGSNDLTSRQWFLEIKARM